MSQARKHTARSTGKLETRSPPGAQPGVVGGWRGIVRGFGGELRDCSFEVACSQFASQSECGKPADVNLVRLFFSVSSSSNIPVRVGELLTGFAMKK